MAIDEDQIAEAHTYRLPSMNVYALGSQLLTPVDLISQKRRVWDFLNTQLPQGAGPIQFHSDFGDTAALMLTIASPRLSDVEIAIRAPSIQKAAEETPVAALHCFPESVSLDAVRPLSPCSFLLFPSTTVVRD